MHLGQIPVSTEDTNRPGDGATITPDCSADNRSAPRSFRLQQFSGDIDITNAADLATRLDRLLAEDATGYVLDFGGVGFLGTSGISLVLAFAEAAADRGVPVTVVAERPLRHVIERCCPGELDILGDRDRALSSAVSRTAR